MMISALLHPVLPFVAAALVMPWVQPAVRRVLGVATPALALAALLALPPDATVSLELLGTEWQFLRADTLARVFALAFIIYAAIAGIYAWTDDGASAKAASLLLAGGGVGIVLAGDLLTLFVFWEWLTIAALFIVWQGGTPGAWQAGLRYVAFHVAGAMVMLAGIALRLETGSTTFGPVDAMDTGAWLILLGMATNAAVPPLHAWLSDAYPRASVFGTVFLSAFTTKAAVYALLRGYAGTEPLVWAGTVMAVFGVVYAVLENDIRRLLAYHIISQVGYMVAGVGMGSALALNGTAAHAFSHIFYKGLLLMSAGAVIYATGQRRLTELGGLARSLPWVLILMMIGALSISGAPLFNGFVSKSMVVSAAAYQDRAPIELLLLLASMGTFLHTGLKLPWFTFYGAPTGPAVTRPVPRSMFIGMWTAAAICIGTGVVPHATLYRLLPFDASYDPFTAHHFLESLQLLAGTGLGFWILRRMLGGEPTVTADVDVLYRRPLALAVAASGGLLESLGRHVRHARTELLTALASGMLRFNEHRHPETTASQNLVIMVAVVVAACIAVLRL